MFKEQVSIPSVKSRPLATLGSEVDQFLAKHNFKNGHIDRIWIHDAIHIITEQTSVTDEAEMIAAIYQSVLLRDPQVNPRETVIKDHGEIPALHVVRACIIPDVMDFIERKEKNSNRYQPPKIDFIAEHYGIAKRLGRLIYRHFNKHLGEFTREELSKITVEFFMNLHKQAKNSRVV